LVNRFGVGIISVIVRIIWIVSVIRIGIVREWVAEIAKEDEPVTEVAVAKPITAKAMAVKATAKPSTVKSGSTEGTAATAKSAATEAAVSLCYGV
jgi:hypothetical protein